MKKLISFMLALLLLLSLFVSCKGGNSGENTTTPQPGNETTPEPGEEYTLEKEDGCNQVTFYWHADGVDYSKCDMWIWYPGRDGHGYLFHPCAYGAKVVLNVPEDITEVGFIVRRDCSDPGGASWGDAVKDYDGDRYAEINGDTEVYLKSGDGAQYLSDDGGKTLYQAKKFTMAGIIALDQIKYNITPAMRITSLDQVKVLDGTRELPIKEISSLNNEVVTGVITLGEELDISKSYTVRIEGYEPQTAVPTAIFDSDEFNAKYAYDGQLGAMCFPDATVFTLWAPTASSVKLNLFKDGDGGEAYKIIDMEKGDKGVWRVEANCTHGTYYTYSVTTAIGENEAVDPYAKAVGVNGNRGMVVDPSMTDPENFSSDGFYQGINNYNEAIIWEVHVRDFSNKIESSKYKGKYLAFTETGLKNASGQSVGIDYLRDLGITHVHLQPVYDYATVDESSDKPQFNWGYDPKNYNAPEGSYSTDPYHGEVRITEFKQMVQALHTNGMGVIMDVVYNHTFDANSNFSRIVPYYYYRYNPNGELSNGSGCGNETASERVMFRKFIVDSVSYWAREYHIDGFRFDLMALHDVETMQAVEKAVHEVNPKAIIYGEGWTGGSTPLGANRQANQANIGKVTATGDGIGAVAVFNDAIRDGLKGSVFDAKDQGYINGMANESTANKVIFGITGGIKNAATSWGVLNNAVINYMACHDNNTLWDKLMISNPDATEEERMEMNRLGISIIMLSKGVPFFLAGEEMLRSKDGDHNSYASSDEVNNIDWDALTEGSSVMRMHDFYRSMILLRRAEPFFREADVECRLIDANAIMVTYKIGGETVAVAVINPNADAMQVDVTPGKLLADGWNVYPDDASRPDVSDSVSVAGRSVVIIKMA